MEPQKLIVVFGATGMQGGFVARALVKDNQYKVRGVTRNTTSATSIELEQLGVEMVKGDFTDEESLKKAVEGAYGVFLVTVYTEHLDAERETKDGISVVDAAKEAGVKHIIFSSLEDAEKVTGLPCPFFKSKVRVADYIRKIDIGYTIVKYAGYFENQLNHRNEIPKKNVDGIYELNYPVDQVPFDMICVSDTGECIHQIFNRPGEFKGQEIGLTSEFKTIPEYAAVLNRVFKDEGRKFKATELTTDDLRKTGDYFFTYYASKYDYIKTGKCIRDLDKTRELNPDIQTYEQWATNNKTALINAMDSLGLQATHR